MNEVPVNMNEDFDFADPTDSLIVKTPSLNCNFASQIFAGKLSFANPC